MMFGLFTQKTVKDNQKPIFEAQEVQDLLQTFSISNSSVSQELSYSSEHKGIVKTKIVIEKIHQWVDGGDGRKLLNEFSDEFALPLQNLLRLLKDLDWVVISSNEPFSIISKNEQTAVIKEIEVLSRTKFVNVQEFSSKHHIDADKLQDLILESQTGPVKFEWFPELGDQLVSEHSYFIASSSLASDLRDDMAHLVSNTKDSISLESFKDLNSTEVVSFSEKHKEKISGQVTGIFRVEGDSLMYLSENEGIEKRDRLIESLVSGDKVFLRKNDLTGTNPGQFADFSQLDDYLTLFATKIQSTPEYLLSLRWIQERANDVYSDVVVNGQSVKLPSKLEIPEQLQEIVRGALKNIISTKSDVVVLDNHIVTKNLIEVAKELLQDETLLVAQESWQNDELNAKNSSIIAKVKSGFQKSFAAKIDDDQNILQALLNQYMKWDNTIINNYNHALNDLETENEDKFRKLWLKLMQKVEVHFQGWEVLEDDSLKEQLGTLLRTYLMTEVNQALKRAKTKGLLKCQRLKLSSKIPKLQAALDDSEDTSISSFHEKLIKFNNKIGVEQQTAEEIQNHASQQLHDMVDAMKNDVDNARLFTSLVIILWSSKSKGILYATGKYAPKILKTLKASIDRDLANELDEAKDAIKKGSVTEDMQTRMRRIAVNAIST